MRNLDIEARKRIYMLFVVFWYEVLPCTAVFFLNVLLVKTLYHRIGIVQWYMMFDKDYLNGEFIAKVVLFCLLYFTPIKGFIEVVWEYNDVYRKKESQ